MEVHIKIIGILLILLASIHPFFPRYFNWKNDLRTISDINRQMLYVHTFFIAIVVCLIGILCLTSSYQLLNTDLGKRICMALGLFWVLRLFFQLFVYSSTLWRRKKFETAVHISFSLLWIYLSSVFLIAAL
jgi:hypothetical protein